MKRSLLLLGLFLLFFVFFALFLVVFPAQAQVNVTLTPTPKVQWLDLNGDPLASGHVHAYISGTTTNQATYTDSTGAVANANPVVLDAAGRAEIWLEDGLAYTLALHDSSNALVWSVDGVSAGDLETALVVGTTAVTFTSTPTFDSSTASYFSITLTGNVTSSTISNASDGRIIYFNICQDATGGRTFTWPASVLTAPTIGSGVSVCTSASFIYDGTNWRELAATSRGSSVFDTSTIGVLNTNRVVDGIKFAQTGAGIQAAIDDLTTGQVFLPCATYSASASITLKNGVDIVGASWGCVTVNLTVTSDTLFEYLAATEQEGARVSIRNLSITADTTTSTVGIGLRLLKNVIIENVSFQTLATGISLDRGRDYKLNNLRMRSVTNGILLTDTSDAAHILDVDLSNILIENITGTGIEFRRAINILGTNINITDDGADSSSIGLHLRNDTQGVSLSSLLVAGLGTGVLIETQTSTPSAVQFSGFVFDNSEGNPLINITGGNQISFSSGTIVGADTNGASITGDFVNFTGVIFQNNDRHDIALISGSTNVQIVGNNFQGFAKDAATTYDQINVAAGVSQFIISANRLSHDLGAGNAARYAINILAGASDEYIVSDNVMLGQGTGGIFNGGTGANKSVFGNQQLSGTAATQELFALEGATSNIPRWILKQVDFSDMTVGGGGANFALWTLPANTMIHDVVGVVVTGWSGGSISAAVASIGTNSAAFDNLALDDNFFAAGTVYELHDATASGGKGTLLYDATDKFAPHMAVSAATVELQMDLTGDTHANATAGQARIYILVSQPLGNTATEAN